MVEAGLAKAAREMGQSLAGAHPSPQEILLYLMHRLLATDPEASVTSGRAEREGSPFAVVFHRCPDCRRAAVETAEGRVEMETEVMDRIEIGAERVVIPDSAPEDAKPEHEKPELPAASSPERRLVPPGQRDPPNTPALRRALCAREGGRCANPFCRRPCSTADHGHHLTPRSEGGRTELSGEVWCCVTCHASIHAGALKVEGDPMRGLVWKPAALDWTRAVRRELEQSRGLAQVYLVDVPGVSGTPDSDPQVPEGEESRRVQVPEAPESEAEAVLQALERLGWPRREARARLERAASRCFAEGQDPRAVPLEDLLREAIRG